MEPEVKLFTGHAVFVRPLVAAQIDPGKPHVHQASVVAVAPSKAALAGFVNPITAHTGDLRMVPASRPLPVPVRDLLDAGLLDLAVPAVLAWRTHGNVVALDETGQIHVVARHRFHPATSRFTFELLER